MSEVIFLGPLPPPVNGFSNINGEMLSLIRERTGVTVLDRQPHTGFFRYAKVLLVFLINLAKLWVRGLSGDRYVMYAGLSGGLGKIIDLPYVVSARLLGIPVFLHHHSFSYLNDVGILDRFFFRMIGPEVTHVLLCEAMAGRLVEKYAVDLGKIFLLSNAAFVPPNFGPVSRPAKPEGALVVGYISNITAEKGIFDFLSSVAELTRGGLCVEARIAGPVETSIRPQFEAALSALPNAEYVGPVYGKRKEEFFNSLDLLLFPTRYRNEAEPLVVYEAMRVGVPTIATSRGCLRDSLSKGNGKAVDESAYVSQICSYVLREQSSGLGGSAYREETSAMYEGLFEKSRSDLSSLLGMICGRGA